MSSEEFGAPVQRFGLLLHLHHLCSLSLTMFARVSALLLVVPFLVAATVIPRGGGRQVNQCDTGSLQCCNSVQAVHPQTADILSGLLGVALHGITGQLGLQCTALPIIGAAGNDCNSQPVCCTDNSFNGIIALGCTPVNVNL